MNLSALLKFVGVMCLLAMGGAGYLYAEDQFDSEDANVPDCTWQPFPFFTNAYVAGSGGDKEQKLYLRLEPSYETVLHDTAPFDWMNVHCNLWQGMRVRIAHRGDQNDRFIKIYYEGRVWWVSKTYPNGANTLIPVESKESSAPTAPRNLQ